MKYESNFCRCITFEASCSKVDAKGKTLIHIQKKYNILKLFADKQVLFSRKITILILIYETIRLKLQKYLIKNLLRGPVVIYSVIYLAIYLNGLLETNKF